MFSAVVHFVCDRPGETDTIDPSIPEDKVLAAIVGFLPQLHGPELLVILAVVLLLFGKRLPELGRSLGRGIVEFKKGLRGSDDEKKDGDAPPPSA